MKFFMKRRRRPTAPETGQYVQRVQKSGLFDANWYIAKYPEIASFPAGPLAHFCEYGLREHRDPGPNFDTRRYLRAVPEAGLGPVPPFLRALDEGEAGNERQHWMPDDGESLLYLLRTSGLLDEAWYYEAYPDVARSRKDALSHYLDYGAIELRDPGPDFDAEHYALTYPAYRVNFSSPIEHYLRVGLRRGYRPKGISPYGRWLAVNDDLTERDCKRIIAEPVSATVRCIFLVNEQSAIRIKAFLSGLAEQIGAEWNAQLLRGQGLDATLWEAVVTQSAGDTRIVCVESIENVIMDFEDGEIVIFGAGPFQLRPHACHVFASALIHSDMEAAYSDHDQMNGDELRHSPIFKPMMSPVFMQQIPYAGPIIAVRIAPRTLKAIPLALKRLEHPDRAWGDLLLGLDPTQVTRIPLILYHQIVDEALPPSRTNQPGANADRTLPWTNELPDPLPTVSIIIPTRDRRSLLQACIESILTVTDYPPDRYEIVIVDNSSTENETLRYFEQVVSDLRVNVIASPGAFNFSVICNNGASDSHSEILVFLNNDMTVRQADWLRKLVCMARRPEVGAVGSQLLYPDDTVQHGGVVLGVDNVGGHALVNLPVSTACALDTTREIGAVTGACLAIRRTLFFELEGFDPLLRVDFNDVDLCCRAGEAGYRNCYIAEPLLYHHESLSRGRTVSHAMRSRSIREANLVRQRHAAAIRDDPFYNPNLSFTKVGHLAVPPRVIPRWRRPGGEVRKLLLLSCLSDAGSDIGRVIAKQQTFLKTRGFEVIVGGPNQEHAFDPLESRQVVLADDREAADFATREGVDAIVAYTAPFFSVTRHLGRRPLVYLIDHGNPPPDLFADRDAWEDAILEKRVGASLARRVFSTSAAARDALFGQEVVLLKHDLKPAAVWSNAWAEQRVALRKKFGFGERFVVLVLCRTGESKSRYTGFGDFVTLAEEYLFTDPPLSGRALFVAADRGSVCYSIDRSPADLVIHEHVNDTDLIELMVASDLYLTTQRWQSEDCGIALALAMGLPVIASDIAAHRSYPIQTALDIPGLCKLIAPHAERWRSGTVRRHAVIAPGPDPLAVLADTIAQDLNQDSAEHWI